MADANLVEWSAEDGSVPIGPGFFDLARLYFNNLIAHFTEDAEPTETRAQLEARLSDATLLRTIANYVVDIFNQSVIEEYQGELSSREICNFFNMFLDQSIATMATPANIILNDGWQERFSIRVLETILNASSRRRLFSRETIIGLCNLTLPALNQEAYQSRDMIPDAEESEVSEVSDLTDVEGTMEALHALELQGQDTEESGSQEDEWSEAPNLNIDEDGYLPSEGSAVDSATDDDSRSPSPNTLEVRDRASAVRIYTTSDGRQVAYF